MEKQTIIPDVLNTSSMKWSVYNSTEDTSGQLLYKAGITLRLYWIPILAIMGLTGNTLSFIVMLQKHNRHISCCVYMAALAVSDCIMLLVSVYFWVFFFFTLNIVWACKLFGYFFYVFTENGIVLIVCMTVDRFIAVIYPLQAKDMNTSRRAKITVLVSLSCLCLSNIPILLSSHITGNTCVAYGGDNASMQIMAWFKLCFNSLFPFGILVTLNIMIVLGVLNKVKLISSISIKDTTTNSTARKNNQDLSEKHQLSPKDIQLVAMLTFVTMALLCFTLPMHLRYLFYNFYDYKQNAYSYAVYFFMYHMTSCLYYTNNGVNFFLYALSGSKFREDVKLILCRQS